MKIGYFSNFPSRVYAKIMAKWKVNIPQLPIISAPRRLSSPELWKDLHPLTTQSWILTTQFLHPKKWRDLFFRSGRSSSQVFLDGSSQKNGGLGILIYIYKPSFANGILGWVVDPRISYPTHTNHWVDGR